MLTENNRKYLTINYNLFIAYSRIRTVTTVHFYKMIGI